MTSEEMNFINLIGNAAVKVYDKYRILPSLTIAQAIVESRWGKSGLSRDCYNFFGMKWRDGCGCDFKVYQTKEQLKDGKYITISAAFRKYSSVDEGIEGYYKFLQYKRYANLKNVTDYKEAYDKADIVVFLTAHTPFKELPWKDDKVILDFCGIFKQ